MANSGAHENQVPQQDNQVPPLEEVDMVDKVMVVPSPMTDGEIREASEFKSRHVLSIQFLHFKSVCYDGLS